MIKTLFSLITIVCVTFTASAQRYLKVSEVYDFQAGDEIHYGYRSFNVEMGPPSFNDYYMEKITSSHLDTANNVFHYTVEETHAYMMWGGNPYRPIGYMRQTSTFNRSQNNLDSFIVDLGIYRCDSADTAMGFTCENYAFLDSNWNNRVANRIFFSTNFEGYDDFTFYEGLGGWYGGWGSYPTIKEKWLIYYKKGQDEWGSKVTVGIDDIYDQGNFTISPNPSEGHFRIELPSYVSGTLIVFDLSNRIVFEEKINNRKILEVDISNLTNPGMYTLSLSTDDQIFVKRLILH